LRLGSMIRVWASAALLWLALGANAAAHVIATTEGAGPGFGRVRPPLEPLTKLPELALIPLSARPALTPTLVEHGPRDGKRLALTFDACSTSEPSGYDARITEVLVRTGTRATLFLGGKWMLRERDHVRELAKIPLFELGLHAYSHPHLTRASDNRITQELTLDEQVLYALTGRRADLFRPPFGEYDDRVLRIAGALGFLTINFDAASGDADPHATRAKLLDWVPRIVKPGSIVVMHINGRGWHTAEALEQLIGALRHEGYELVTVSELLGRKGAGAYAPPVASGAGAAVAPGLSAPKAAVPAPRVPVLTTASATATEPAATPAATPSAAGRVTAPRGEASNR
jgi:peptidoglycan/xylan/chitin deacetylase (PgdA/CDA1 family)